MNLLLPQNLPTYESLKPRAFDYFFSDFFSDGGGIINYDDSEGVIDFDGPHYTAFHDVGSLEDYEVAEVSESIALDELERPYCLLNQLFSSYNLDIYTDDNIQILENWDSAITEGGWGIYWDVIPNVYLSNHLAERLLTYILLGKTDQEKSDRVVEFAQLITSRFNPIYQGMEFEGLAPYEVVADNFKVVLEVKTISYTQKYTFIRHDDKFALLDYKLFKELELPVRAALLWLVRYLYFSLAGRVVIQGIEYSYQNESDNLISLTIPLPEFSLDSNFLTLVSKLKVLESDGSLC